MHLSLGSGHLAALRGARDDASPPVPFNKDARRAASGEQDMPVRVAENDLMADRDRRRFPDCARRRHVSAVLGALVVIAYGASAFLSMPRGYHELLFAAIIGGLGWLVLGALSRQRRAVAELRSRKEQLAGQRALLQSALENMGEGFSVFDRDGRLIAWNSRFIRLLKLPIDPPRATLREILRQQALRGDFGPVDIERDVEERAERFYRDLPFEFERAIPGGRILQIRRRAMPDGAVVSRYSDITKRKTAEAMMEQARAEAEFANRAKSDFLANMSHELRTPLNAIIGFSAILAGEILGPVADPRQLEYIRDIHSSGLLLLSIINDVLDMSKIEAGKFELAQEMVSVQRVVAEAVRMVSERARSRKVELVSTLKADEAAIPGDERALRQIMLNLLSNAVKFSHEGGRVDIRALLDEAAGLVLEVEDYGIGMAGREIDRALQPFGQAKPATTRTHGGTGLGLPIAKGLVEAHGGQLAIASTPGQGTRVRIVLPRQSGAPLPAAPTASPPQGKNKSRRAIA